MNKSNYSVEIFVNGHSVKEYWKGSDVYIEGRRNQEYSLKIRNNGCSRILVIPTIDGLSVLNGKDATFDSPGYIINGYDSLTIDGWRHSDTEVARFYFTDPQDSYNQRIGRQNNCGVIGVVIFKEKKHEVSYKIPSILPSDYPYPTYTASIPVNYQTEISADFSQDLGTGWGVSKESRVITIEFDKETCPDAIFTIFYNTREQLQKIGVSFSERPKYVGPQAFPGKYCESPK